MIGNISFGLMFFSGFRYAKMIETVAGTGLGSALTCALLYFDPALLRVLA